MGTFVMRGGYGLARPVYGQVQGRALSWGREQGKETSRHAAAEHGRAYAAGTPRHAGPKPLNTPEELRAIRQAMDEGKNPLLATGVPRWEDQVGVSRIINRRVLELEPLPTPGPGVGGTAS